MAEPKPYSDEELAYHIKIVEGFGELAKRDSMRSRFLSTIAELQKRVGELEGALKQINDLLYIDGEVEPQYKTGRNECLRKIKQIIFQAMDNPTGEANR